MKKGEAIFIAVLNKDQIECVASLAREIWTEHYISIIGKDQVDYMLDRFQSQQAIDEQIRAGALYFLVRRHDAFVGYLSVMSKQSELFLSKLYVRASDRGQGHGRSSMRFVELLARQRGLGRITLTVNKNNTRSITAYEKMGFTITNAVVQDIGNGFVMDDFQMELTVRGAEER